MALAVVFVMLHHYAFRAATPWQSVLTIRRG